MKNEDEGKKESIFIPAINANALFNSGKVFRERMEKDRQEAEKRWMEEEHHLDMLILEERKGKIPQILWFEKLIGKFLYGNKTKVEISFIEMGVFPKLIPDQRAAKSFLIGLQEEGCFKSWYPYSSGFVIEEPSIEKMKAAKKWLQENWIENQQISAEEEISWLKSKYKRFRVGTKGKEYIIDWDENQEKIPKKTFQYLEQLLRAHPDRLNPSNFHGFGKGKNGKDRNKDPKYFSNLRGDVIKQLSTKFPNHQNSLSEIICVENSEHSLD